MITLNKHADLCEQILMEKGVISGDSPSNILIYEMSRHWRQLCRSTGFRVGEWSEKEKESAKLLFTVLAYLNRIGCTDIERLLKDTMWEMSNSAG